MLLNFKDREYAEEAARFYFNPESRWFYERDDMDESILRDVLYFENFKFLITDGHVTSFKETEDCVEFHPCTHQEYRHLNLSILNLVLDLLGAFSNNKDIITYIPECYKAAQNYITKRLGFVPEGKKEICFIKGETYEVIQFRRRK